MKKELAIFKNLREEFLTENPHGGYVVIKDGEVLGIFPTRTEALHEGFRAYGNVLFLVRNINEETKVVNFALTEKHI